MSDPMEPTPETAKSKDLPTPTASEPRVNTLNPELDGLAKDMFDKVSVYMQGNLEGSVGYYGTIDEYKLLENMNKQTSQRYADMKEITAQVTHRLDSLNTKYANLKPYLDQIEEIDTSSRRLEEAAYALDSYVKNLENKLKQIEKR